MMASESKTNWSFDSLFDDEQDADIVYPAHTPAEVAPALCLHWRGYIMPWFILPSAPCCEFCELLRQALAAPGSSREGSDSPDIQVYSRQPYNFIKITPQYGYTVKVLSFEGVLCPWGLLSPLSSPVIHGLSTDNSASVLTKAVTAVAKCVANHSCGNSDDLPLLPTRVLDIEQGPEGVRLTQGAGRRARYICLSHCWGSEQPLPLRTTKHKISDFLQSIPWDDIPACYQDAILVARNFGVHYVWIDSLCIVQDDLDDWVRESQSMCDIYENSYVTIYATAAPNCHASILELSRNSTQVIRGVNSAGQPYSYRVISGVQDSHPGFLSTKSDMIEKWPLLDRAWAFQERLLSPRVLHFCHGELMFECKEEVVCECGGIREFGKNKSYHNVLQAGSGEDLVTSTWQEVVEWYSMLSLSVKADRLPALSGMAQRFARLQPDATYLSGLWDKTLATDLLWYNPNGYYTMSERAWRLPSLRHAPSWSWAATDSPVAFATSPDYSPQTYAMIVVKEYFRIKSVWCKLASMDKTGRVAGGQLNISGRLYNATLTRTVGHDSISLHLDGFATAFQTATSNEPWILFLDFTGDPFQGTHKIPENGRVVCLPLARIARDSLPIATSEVEYAMVLVPRPDSKEEYQRIGLTAQRSRSGSQKEILEFWQKHPSPFEAGGRKGAVTIL